MASVAPESAEAITIRCDDGVVLGGHWWPTATAVPLGLVVINPATGVLARYYHYYARFLTASGFDVLTYDYRGIGLSRPERLRGSGYRWRDWGQLDFDAAIRFANQRRRQGALLVVGHSVGGFLPGLAKNGHLVERMLTVGAQYAYWPDYAAKQRARLFFKWHVVMPAVTALLGYFPGRKFGWLEDLPAGVANEWSFKGARTERSYPKASRAEVLERFAAFQAPILAVVVSDDELGTVSAVRRSLGYYGAAAKTEVMLSPHDLGQKSVGHFDLFHARHTQGFWADTLHWLRDGINPWPGKPYG
ncbi:alpha/beta fold hydrolase [Dyella sp. GSA-30]|uniref:alpha/beta hydrolase family protein n=1 Tax=Dyella sp. GSA-30 TaxID=2994496 RepID=UPI002491ACE6|nr:alpha/beta fold hydrolase [Dyella sp. GSA-30]